MCECVFACRPAGLGNRWRLWANSADAGVENPAVELRLRGESAAADWGPGWRTDVMEPAFSRTSLSPTVCRSDCLSVALTVEPPAYLGLPVCLHALLTLNLTQSIKALLFHPVPLKFTKPMWL